MPNPDHAGMLRELLEYDGGRLTGWEIDFLESLERQENNLHLSDKQSDVLARIWNKVFE